MNQPQKPADPPTKGAPPNSNPAGNTPDGIPEELTGQEAKGTPESGRNETEATPGQ